MATVEGLERAIVCDAEHTVWYLRALLELAQPFHVEPVTEDADGNRGRFWRIQVPYECRPAHLQNRVNRMPNAPARLKCEMIPTEPEPAPHNHEAAS